MNRAAALALAIALPGCALFQSDEDQLRDNIVDTATDQIGEDYRYGGDTPDEGFDCSGLVYYSYYQSGITLPRSAARQHRIGTPIKFSDAKPGDLLFYHFGDRKKTDLHVVMYLGDGEGVHAPVADGEVEKIDVTRPEWKKRFVGARRYIRES